jgi:hypothetical protein
MRLFLSATALCLALQSAWSAETSSASTETFANIDRGHWRVSASLYLAKDSTEGSTQDQSTTDVFLAGEYFFVDRVSAGAQLGYEAATGDDAASTLGPLVTWHFWQQERLVTYLRGGLRFGLTDASWKTIVVSFLGANYFINPSVAFGPALFYRRYSSQSGRLTENLGVSADFSIYL